MKTLLRLSGTIIFLILSLKFFQWCFIYICLSKPIQYDRCLESFLGICVYKYLENRKHTEILFYRKNKIIKSISNKWKTVLSINKWCSKQNNVRFLLVCMCMYLPVGMYVCDWETSLSLFTFMHWRRKWQPTPVF